MNKKLLTFFIACFGLYCIGIVWLQWKWDTFGTWYYSFLDHETIRDHAPVVAYNRALAFAQEGNYVGAREILEPALPYLTSYTSQAYELYGDILWGLQAETGSLQDVYERALGNTQIPRILYKLSLLQTPPQIPDPVSGESGMNHVEAPDIEAIMKSIETDQTERREFINPLPTDAATQRAEYERLRYLIESDAYTQDKDW